MSELVRTECFVSRTLVETCQENKSDLPFSISALSSTIFLLTGLRIYTGEYKAEGPTLCPTEGGHYEGRGLCIRLYRYANQLVRSLLPD